MMSNYIWIYKQIENEFETAAIDIMDIYFVRAANSIFNINIFFQNRISLSSLSDEVEN